MSDPVSGELVIVPDAEALGTITEHTYLWQDAVDFAAAYDDGTNTDYRLITRAEALAILGSAELVQQLGLPVNVNGIYWTIEEHSSGSAWAYDTLLNEIVEEDKGNARYFFTNPQSKLLRFAVN